ncbi:MAG: hypothetical protein AB8B99_16550 [Phormidesmis sp.]
MSNVGLDTTRWDHWLLIISFAAIAASGLCLSWQWQQEQWRHKQWQQEQWGHKQWQPKHYRQRKASKWSQRLSLQRHPHREQTTTPPPEHKLSAHDLSQHILKREQAARRYTHPKPRTARLRTSRSGRYLRAKRHTFPTRIR